MTHTTHRLLWLALLAVCLNVFVAALDLTVMASVLPQLIVDFQVPLPGGLADTAWIVNAYLIAYVVTMPLAGKISDLYGRRIVFVVCLALFAAGSVGAALARDVWPMVVARAVQALGGGAMVPVALAAVSDAVPRRFQALAIGVVAAVDTAGWVAGSAYGAWITTQFGWPWAFWLNVPIALLGIVLVMIALPAGEQRDHRIDWVGAALLTLALLTFTTGLYLGAPAGAEGGALLAEQGAPTASPFTWPLLALALGLAGVFVWWERRAAEPIIPLRLVTDLPFSAAHGVSLLTGMVLMAIMVEIPVLLQAISSSVGEAIASSGLLLAIFAGAMMLWALLAGLLERLFSSRLLTMIGLLLTVLGLWQMAQWQQSTGVGALRGPLALAGSGLGLVTTTIATVVLASVVESRRGIAASLLLVARLLGMTLGLSVLVTWALQRYETLIAAAEVPALSDPAALERFVALAAEVMTTVVTDLFRVSTLIAALALLPALFLVVRRHDPSASSG
ncbi:MAG: MFS transporter [Ardenticatenales bacterium]|nr:MFS transporter [Ardenticatenales bacterium]